MDTGDILLGGGNPAMDKHPVQGEVAILLGILHATETGISSGRFGPLARVHLYLFFNDKNKNQRFLCNNCALRPGLHTAAKIAIFDFFRKSDDFSY